MQVRLMFGPAGSGKTHRCLAEIRERLVLAPEGPPLLLIAPKQNTFTLERKLLEHSDLKGFTRLHILSFERLAELIYQYLRLPQPELLDEEGRSMVLRSLLARQRNQLQLFRASARLTGFARQLSMALHELQRNQVDPETLRAFADKTTDNPSLALKLKELSALFGAYQDRMRGYGLQDAGCLLETVTRTLNESPPTIFWDAVWVDGFADLSGQEIDLLAAVIQRSREAVLTLCVDSDQTELNWLSPWWLTRKCLQAVEKRFSRIPGLQVRQELLSRNNQFGRFKTSPVLARLEADWCRTSARTAPLQPGDALQLVVCENPEAEAVFAAREIRRHARGGGRYREVLVLVRSLEPYFHGLQRAFTRFEVPFFMDRRESVSHHPLPELTRNALRTAAFEWRMDDWLAVLKTGLVPATEEDVDSLENETLARGWEGKLWCQPIRVEKDPGLEQWVRALQDRLVPPFLALAEAIKAAKDALTGPQLAALILDLWRALNVEQTLTAWANAAPGRAANAAGMVHASVWNEMNAWLDNIRMAFAEESFTIKEWLPILDAGLAGISVGLIPPAIDQVLIGTIDRSRNPEARLVIVLGMNETVFPASPQGSALLTEADRQVLAQRNVLTGATAREQMSRERHFAYLACTRASERLILSHALNDSAGAPLNASPFIAQAQRLFSALDIKRIVSDIQPCDTEHWSEVRGVWGATGDTSEDRGIHLDETASPPEWLPHRLGYREPNQEQEIPADLAVKLYGKVLRTSVSRLEQFSACPFRFFVHSGLRVQERRLFEADFREQGSFQHDLLALFHESLTQEGKRWRDVSSTAARERVRELARKLAGTYHDGLLENSGHNRFLAGLLAKAVEDFVATSVEWMRDRYRFDPVAVELPFGEAEGAPAWQINLDDDRKLELRGRIDRVDICQGDGPGDAWCVVVDYKSSQKKLEPLLVENGLQLQLLGYLNVLRRWPGAAEFLGVRRLLPAGVFYVNLRGAEETARVRSEALADPEELRRTGFRHTGRFDRGALDLLDARAQEVRKGSQFNYRLTKDGGMHNGCKEPMASHDFLALLDELEDQIRTLGNAIYSGSAAVSPYRKGNTTACEFCDYSAICRMDNWVHKFRVLRKAGPGSGRAEREPTVQEVGI